MRMTDPLSNAVRSLPLLSANGRSWKVRKSTIMPIILIMICSIFLLPFLPKLNLESNSLFMKMKMSLSIPATAITISKMINSFIHCSNLWAEFSSSPRLISSCLMNSNILSIMLLFLCIKQCYGWFVISVDNLRELQIVKKKLKIN